MGDKTNPVRMADFYKDPINADTNWDAMEAKLGIVDSSEAMKRVVSYYNDDDFEYQAKYAALQNLPESTLDRGKRWLKYLPETRLELERIQGQSQSSDKAKPGYFKMGTVELLIPPIQISINDIKKTFSYKTLRTNSDTTFTSGHSNKMIEMDVYFNGLDDINDKLRPILAQIRAVPFIVIENDHISNLIDPRGMDVKFTNKDGSDETVEDGMVKDITKLKAKEDLLKAELKEALDSASRVGAISGEAARNAADSIDNKERFTYHDSIGLDIDGNIHDNIDKTIRDSAYDRFKDTSNDSDSKYTQFNREYYDLKTIAYKVQEEIEALKEEISSKVDRLPSNAQKKTLVAVLSQLTVSTVPGFPESLLCHFSFYVFNYYPFSHNFEFIDAESMATNDIDECEYFIKWYSDRFLSKKSSSDEYLEEITSSMTGDLVLSYDYVVEDDSDEGEIKEEIVPLMVSTDSKSVCSSIVVSHRNDIAFMPILSWSMPTCQYMGRRSSEILISIETIDKSFVEALKFLSELIDERTRNTSDKARGVNYVNIKNEILSLNGINAAIIGGIDVVTVPGSPELLRVTLNCIEYNVKQLARELIQLAPGVTKDRMIAIFDVAYKRTLNSGGKGSDEFPLGDAIKDACLIYDDVIKVLGAVDDPLRFRGFKNISSVYGHKVRTGTGIDLKSSPASKSESQSTAVVLAEIHDEVAYKIGNNLEKLRKAKARYDRIHGATTKLVRSSDAEFAITGERLKRVSLDSLPDVTYDSVEEYVNGKWDSFYMTSRRIMLRTKIEEPLFQADLKKEDRSVNKIPDSVKLAIIHTPTMKKWKDNKEKALVNYMHGEDSRESGRNLNSDEIEMLISRGIDKYQSETHITYPDMNLPVYGDLIGLKKPSYSILGLSPGKLKDPEESPRNDYDIVEPDFYFKGMEVKKSSGLVNTPYGTKQFTYSDEIAGVEKLAEVVGAATFDKKARKERAKENVTLNEQSVEYFENKDSGPFDRTELDEDEENLVELSSTREANIYAATYTDPGKGLSDNNDSQ